MLIHVSRDYEPGEKTFIPRLPKFRITGEDNIIKRVCFSTSIQKALSSFPYKNLTKRIMFANLPSFLFVYSLDESTLTDSEYCTPEQLKGLVDDVHLTDEHWILKDLTLTPSMVRIKELQFERLCKYTSDYSGQVTELEYEKDTETYERVEHAVFYHSRIFKQFKKACERTGVELLEVNESKEHMEYFGVLPSSRMYTVRRVTYRVPAGVSALEVWKTIAKEIHANRRKYPVFDKGEFDSVPKKDLSLIG